MQRALDGTNRVPHEAEIPLSFCLLPSRKRRESLSRRVQRVSLLSHMVSEVGFVGYEKLFVIPRVLTSNYSE